MQLGIRALRRTEVAVERFTIGTRVEVDDTNSWVTGPPDHRGHYRR